MPTYFATCAKGLEPLLADEIRALPANDVQPGRGGVHFSGDREVLYKANLWLRTAVRVLQPILHAQVGSPEELYDVVRTIKWGEYLTPDHTLAVDCNVRDSHLTHSHYAALKTKDAICDQFVDQCGRRPSVDVDNPMLALNLHVYRDEAILSLDSSGHSLHKRGYRSALTKAPLNEALAAGLLLWSGWKPTTPFVDPLCGSGTLPIEAAWLALRRPPGLTRRHFGFQGWLDYDVKMWTMLRDQAREAMLKTLPIKIAGTEQRRDALDLAELNARAAGVGHLLSFAVQPLHAFQPPLGPPGTLLCNPPYGERLGEERELVGLYKQLGKIFRERCAGWQAWVFTGNERLARIVGLPIKKSIDLFNGRIRCELVQYDLG